MNKNKFTHSLWSDDEFIEEESGEEGEDWISIYPDDEEDPEDKISEDPMEVNEYIMKNQASSKQTSFLAPAPANKRPACKGIHSGSEIVIKHKGKIVSGAEGDCLDPSIPDLVIDLAGVYKKSADGYNNLVSHFAYGEAGLSDSKLGSKYKNLAKNLNNMIHVPHLLRIRWPDMGTIPVGKDFWSLLWSNMPKRTTICCHGGHGRTGTALAALMITVQGTSPSDAIKRVREYCPRAIETDGQEDYLHMLD
jgi:hypothetical protein